MLTFLEVGFAANLVQGFRAYAWRAVPSLLQIALCFPSLALWPQPFWLDAAELSKILTDYSFAVDIVNFVVRIVLINAAGAAKAEKVEFKNFLQ